MIEGLGTLGTTIFLTTHYMDEAEHLADRVAILRDGRFVALGKPGELGTAETVIHFQPPPADEIEALRASLTVPLELSDGIATLRTENPQRTLYELTSWAELEHVELRGLEAIRPNLETVFLELTGAAQ